jgi:S-formylglutathione hydrolase
MSEVNTLSKSKSFGGIQGVYEHDSVVNACKMTFAVFMPPSADSSPVPVIWYLSGLTCTHSNVMDKGEYRRLAAELGLAIVCPDTSPRGESIPDESDNWQFGTGAAFYLDATQAPYASNYNMYSYVVAELPSVVGEHFNVDLSRQGIMGHSMGGHGALTIALKNEGLYKSCSAFAPIASHSISGWSKSAFGKFLGEDSTLWSEYDAVELISLGHQFSEFLVDQGGADSFLEEGLKPWLLEAACAEAGIKLTLRMQEGYDHSYSFISTFMDDHIRWHGKRLLTS